MQSFEITHWGKKILVTPVKTNVYQLYYNEELIASITQRANNGKLSWTSPNLEDSDANLVGSIITSKLF